MILDLYKRIPDTRITDIVLDVDAAVAFTDAFPHLRTGVPCRDRIGLLNMLLAQEINLGLAKMAESTSTHGYWDLMRISRCHVEGEAMNRTLAMVIGAQAELPMAQVWGVGITASTDGQFFPAARQGENMNLVNAKNGSEPGLKAYTDVSDRFAGFCSDSGAAPGFLEPSYWRLWFIFTDGEPGLHATWDMKPQKFRTTRILQRKFSASDGASLPESRCSTLRCCLPAHTNGGVSRSRATLGTSPPTIVCTQPRRRVCKPLRSAVGNQSVLEGTPPTTQYPCSGRPETDHPSS